MQHAPIQSNQLFAEKLHLLLASDPASCALKKAANNEALHNLNAPPSQAKIRL
jgi:hypothetical protein